MLLTVFGTKDTGPDSSEFYLFDPKLTTKGLN